MGAGGDYFLKGYIRIEEVKKTAQIFKQKKKSKKRQTAVHAFWHVFHGERAELWAQNPITGDKSRN